MSPISYVIIGIFFVACFLFVMMQKNSVKLLNQALDHKDYAKVIELCEKNQVRRSIGEFNCDLYRLKAIFNSKSEDVAKEALIETIEKQEKLENKEDLLDLYFHVFLQKNRRNICDELMSMIEDLHDETFYMYQKWSYEVVLNKRDDFIVEMDQAIEDNRMKGFGLGITTYLIAMQYEYKGDLDNALSYYYAAIPCFHPGNMYTELAKKNTNRLAEQLGKETRV